jgi:hypothetical protein
VEKCDVETIPSGHENTRGYPHVIRDQVSSMNGDILTTLGQGYGNG